MGSHDDAAREAMRRVKTYVASIFIPYYPPATDVFATNPPRSRSKYTRRRIG
jgi:hypothetical protein